jgi:dihydrodipicolinate synthase/N-acetylneuraminate lyase
LLEPVLSLGATSVREWTRRPVVLIAGIVGPTKQAVREARLARDLGYDVGLVSLGGLAGWSDRRLLGHLRELTTILPVMGFYLQPAVGGRLLGYPFWRQFAELPGAVAIKVAPFDRYRTVDVVRAVADAGRLAEISLYTGNDDAIVADLVTEYRFRVASGRLVRARFVGGLLGHWAYWTRQAVRLVAECRRIRGHSVPRRLLDLAAATTDANAAIFDAGNGFRGCIPGIHEVLRRQGLLRGTWCLDPAEQLSAGQRGEIDRVMRAYPVLSDDSFVQARLDRWLAD